MPRLAVGSYFKDRAESQYCIDNITVALWKRQAPRRDGWAVMLVSPSQYGFRSGISTSDAVLDLTNTVVDKLDGKQKVIGIFLYLAKAFDTISIPALILKLERLGIRGAQLSLFESYLTGRRQCVKIGDWTGNELPVTHGVPQGSIIGPTLLLVFATINLNKALFLPTLMILPCCSTLSINPRIGSIVWRPSHSDGGPFNPVTVPHRLATTYDYLSGLHYRPVRLPLRDHFHLLWVRTSLRQNYQESTNPGRQSKKRPIL
ncbi:hypothetical protein evm_002778 [Chilo suppressalis]|nr:hypothetical protein evm_002778 [Chilo suppressalis]